MPSIRRAEEKDAPQITVLLKELGLFYPGLQLKDFWVAEENRRIIGAVQITEYDKYYFLGSLGVGPKFQRRGIARQLLREATKGLKKDIYLYTVIPEFFEKLGFRLAVPAIELPSKEGYECEACFSDRCRTMVIKKHDS